MEKFEFTIPGPPLSRQTRDRQQLRAWQDRVRQAAQDRLPDGKQPFSADIALQITVTYFHEGNSIRLDNDNMIKPIQDALNGLVYTDDCQITDTRLRKSSIDGAFRVRRLSSVLAEAFMEGGEFLYIRIEPAPDHSELL
jgi:crossover junction endodeoxyribonuclease RusA